MLRQGTVVSLNNEKTFQDGEGQTTIPAGSSGSVAQVTTPNSGETLYAIYFGALGQCYCREDELSVLVEAETRRSNIRILDDILERARIRRERERSRASRDPEEDVEDMGPLEEEHSDAILPPPPIEGLRHFSAFTATEEPEDDSEETVPTITIDVEADIARRMKELERENS